MSRTGPTKHIVLLGASIGRAWNIPGLPSRLGIHEYEFEYVHGGSSFDKTEKLMEILGRREGKPDAIFLKECAAYFPGDLDVYKNLMTRWVQECRAAGVIPIPATVVPVTKLHSVKKFAIDIAKFRNPFKLGGPFSRRRIKDIVAYNDWIRDFCRRLGLACLDLEAALRYGPQKRYLRSGLARIDGLHINAQAYLILDRIVVPTLAGVDWSAKAVEPGR